MMQRTLAQNRSRNNARALSQPTTLKSNCFEIETEITVKGLRNGFKLEETPILCLRREEGKSRLRILFDGIKMFTIILRCGIAPITHDTHNQQTDGSAH
jgi:hypothetical protein